MAIRCSQISDAESERDLALSITSGGGVGEWYPFSSGGERALRILDIEFAGDQPQFPSRRDWLVRRE
jgi:hypothetical protein